MTRHAAWYLPILLLLLLLALWAAVSASYYLGAERVRFNRSGAVVSFDREHDFALFALGNGAAILSSGSGSLSTVKIERGTFPFCPLCGEYEPTGTLVNGSDYIDGEWLYRAPIALPPDANEASQGALYNIVTGERVRVPPGATMAQQEVLLLARGLELDPSKRVTPAVLEARTTPVAAINESCVVFQAAFLLVIGAWGLLGLGLLLTGRLFQRAVK